MTEAEVLAACRLAIADECFVEVEHFDRASTAADIPGWDSLAHVRIMMNLEARLGREIDIRATYRMSTIGDLVDLLTAPK